MSYGGNIFKRQIDVIFSCPNELRWADNIDVQTILLFSFFFCLKVDVKSISTAHQNHMKIVTWEGLAV
jgi:hypothetical protein